MPRGFGDQQLALRLPLGGPCGRHAGAQRRKPFEVVVGPGWVLVVDQPAQSRHDDPPGCRFVMLPCGAVEQRLHLRMGSNRHRLWGAGGQRWLLRTGWERQVLRGRCVGRERRAQRLIVARAEGAEARSAADAASADRLHVVIAAKGQCLACGKCAQQHRADHAALLLGHPLHVKGDQPASRSAGRCEECRALRATIAKRGFLGHGVDPVGGAHEDSSLRGDESPLHCTGRLHELGGDHHIHIARKGHQRHHRARVAAGMQHNLHVVHGGTGALRDSGHRGALRHVTVMLGKVNQPVGEDPAALAAHREHCDADQPWRFPTQTDSPIDQRALRAASRRCSHAITALRSRWRSRSQAEGWLTMLAL